MSSDSYSSGSDQHFGFTLETEFGQALDILGHRSDRRFRLCITLVVLIDGLILTRIWWRILCATWDAKTEADQYP
jgi:hypothetical protein